MNASHLQLIAVSETNPYQPPRTIANDLAAQERLGHTNWPVCEDVVVDAETYVRAQLIHLGWKLPISRIVSCLFGVVLIVVCFRHLLYAPKPLSDWMAIAALLLVLWSVLGKYLVGVEVRSRLRRIGRETIAVRYEISPTHLRVLADGEETCVEWRLFHGFKEDDHLLLAYRSKHVFYIIPIGIFSVEDRETIRGLLGRAAETS